MLSFNRIIGPASAFWLMALVHGFFITPAIPAESLPEGTYRLEQATLTYHVDYFTKRVTGVSKEARGKGVCATSCRFVVAAPAKSFQSGDANRDSNMLETMLATRFPLVQADITLERSLAGQTLRARFEVTLAGKVKVYPAVPVSITRTEGGRYMVHGEIPLVLSDFEIERPSLLLVKIEDLAPVSFEATWTVQP